MPNFDLFNGLHWLEFSHHHCVAICAAMVPANLLATLQTLVLTFQPSKRRRLWGSILLANSLALLLSLHVLSWLWVGVIMPPTYILFSLALVCLSLNAWALLSPLSLKQVLHRIYQLFQKGLTRARFVA
jgi:hypothetical protein